MSEAIRIASVAAIPPGARTVVEARGKRIAVFNVGGRFHAIDEACSHEGGPLSEGTLDGTVVTCPWHGARFDVTTGAVLRPPARRAVASYAVRVSGPDLLLELPAAAEGSRGTGAEPATVSADPAQRWVYVNDGSNNRVWILNRETLEVVGGFSSYGRQGGQVLSAHSMAVDSRGNIYIGETRGRGVQRFLLVPR